MGKKLTQEEFEDRLKKYPDIASVGEYISSKTQISITYVCGHMKLSINPGHLMRLGTNSFCKVCTPVPAHNRLLDAEINTKLLSYPDIDSVFGYKSRKSSCTIKYKCGHTREAIVGDLFYKGTNATCSICRDGQFGPKITGEDLVYKLKKYPDILRLDGFITTDAAATIVYNCRHTKLANVSNLLYGGANSRCITCNPSNNTSKAEVLLGEYIQKYYNIERGNRLILSSKELDIVIPDLKIAIEFNGIYWHSTKQGKDKNYHNDKTIAAKAAGYKLIHIWDYEWETKRELVLSRVDSLLGRNLKLGARTCTIKEIPYPAEFLEANHLQGKGTTTKINLALYYKDELVSVMTFSKPRFNRNYDYELVRFCTLSGITIQGGASKLFKYFTKKYKGSIISYSDRRWGTGSVYTQLGFKHERVSEPNYFYHKGTTIIPRYKAQKAKLALLVPEYYEEEFTESQIMENAGYLKCYDCGNDVFSHQL